MACWDKEKRFLFFQILYLCASELFYWGWIRIDYHPKKLVFNYIECIFFHT